jgi:hypothetical protein
MPRPFGRVKAAPRRGMTPRPSRRPRRLVAMDGWRRATPVPIRRRATGARLRPLRSPPRSDHAIRQDHRRIELRLRGSFVAPRAQPLGARTGRCCEPGRARGRALRQVGLRHRQPALDRRQHRAGLARLAPRWRERVADLGERRREPFGELEQDLRTDDAERRQIRSHGALLAPHVELAEHGLLAPRQLRRSFDPAELVRAIAVLRDRAQLRERGELFARPLGPPRSGEPLGQPGRERHQVRHVGERVRLLLGSQRPPRPVVLLAALAELDAQLVADQRLQPELGIAEEARRDTRVEHRAEREPELAAQRRHVVVPAVHDLDDRCIGKDWPERCEIADRERIDEPRPDAGSGKLQQADLLGVMVQAVALEIEGDRAAALERRDQLVELLGVTDPSCCHGHV